MTESPKLASLVDLGSATTYKERAVALASVRSRSTEEVDAALVELAQDPPNTYNCLLAVKLAGVKECPSAPAILLKLLSHPSPHVMYAAAHATVKLVKDDDAIVAAFSNLCPAAQKRLLAQVRGRRGQDGKRRSSLAEKLLPLARKLHGPSAAAALRKVATPATTDAFEAAEAVHVKWHVLATKHPALVLDHVLTSVSAAKPWAVKSVLEGIDAKVWRALATLVDKSFFLQLLTSSFAAQLPQAVIDAMHPLLKTHADVVGQFVASRVDEGVSLPPWLLRRHNLRKLPDECITRIGRGIKNNHRDFVRLLKVLPPNRHAQLVADVQMTLDWSSDIGRNVHSARFSDDALGPDQYCPSYLDSLVTTISREGRIAEARRLLSQAGCSGNNRLQILALLPLDEVEEELKAACRVPDEDTRAQNLILLMKSCWLSGDVTAALKWIIEKTRTERPTVRDVAVKSLISFGMRDLFKNEHLALLQQAFVHAKAKPDELREWKRLCGEILKSALERSTYDSLVAKWALQTLQDLQDGWAELAQENFNWEYGECGFLFNMLDAKDVSPRARGRVKISTCKLSKPAVTWFWTHVADPLLSATRATTKSDGAEKGGKGGKGGGKCFGGKGSGPIDHYKIVLRLAEFFARGSRYLFTLDTLKPLLQECKDMLESEDFAFVQPANLGGKGQSSSSSKKLNMTHVARCVELLLSAQETLEEALAKILGQANLLPALASGQGPTSDGRAHQGTAVTRLAAARPDLVLKHFFSIEPPTVDEAADDSEDYCGDPTWPAGLRPPPFHRAVSFARWLPEQQKEFFARWLRPALGQTGKSFPSQMVGSMNVQPRSPCMWAAIMMAKLTFCQDVLPTLQEECARQVGIVLDLQKKIKEADEAALAGDGETGEAGSEANAKGKGKGKVASDDCEPGSSNNAELLSMAEAMVQNVAIGLSKSLQSPSSSVPTLKDAIVLGGESGKCVVKALRRAMSFVETDAAQEFIVAALQKKDLAGIGVRKELLRSLDSNPKVLLEQWDEKAHRDVRCALISVCAGMAATTEAASQLLETAAVSVSSSTPLESNGYFVAQALVKASTALTASSVPHGQQQAYVSKVLGKLLSLPSIDGRSKVRLDVLDALQGLVSTTAASGDAAKLLPLMASNANAVASDPESTWEERKRAVKLIVSCCWGAPDECLTCVRRFSDPGLGPQGARLLCVVLQSFRELPREELLACRPAISQIADITDVPVLKRLSLAFKLETLPWTDPALLPAQLVALCNSTPAHLEQQLFDELMKTLGRSKRSEEADEALRSSAPELEKGTRLTKTAACAVALTLSKRSSPSESGVYRKGKGKGKGFKDRRASAGNAPSSFTGFARELLDRLQNDEDDAIKMRAFWIAVSHDALNERGEKEDVADVTV